MDVLASGEIRVGGKIAAILFILTLKQPSLERLPILYLIFLSSYLNLLNTENIKYSNFIRIPNAQSGTITVHAEAVPFTPTIYLNISFWSEPEAPWSCCAKIFHESGKTYKF